ncbi:VOC family protein, partial [Streptomyces sparsus]
VTEQPPEPPQPPAPARTVPEPAARGAAGNDGGHLWTPALLDGELAAGLRQKSDGRMPTVWTVYLATDDIRRTTERARAAGGQVITDPVLVGGGPAGVLATVADPSGAVFNLWQPVEHSGFGVTGRPGGYVWTEVHTRDKEAVDAFYREVFGYETRVLDSGGADFLMWAPRGEPADEQHAVGGRSLIDASQPAELPAHFLTYFTVADCDEAARTVTRLGGRVLSEPETGEHGRFAVLVDNQGAVFAVLDPESAVSRG